MPKETTQAIKWALQQICEHPEMGDYNVSWDTPVELVDKVRAYFNDNNIEYEEYDFNDLKQFR